jgi:hypothetical protein
VQRGHCGYCSRRGEQAPQTRNPVLQRRAFQTAGLRCIGTRRAAGKLASSSPISPFPWRRGPQVDPADEWDMRVAKKKGQMHIFSCSVYMRCG